MRTFVSARSKVRPVSTYCKAIRNAFLRAQLNLVLAYIVSDGRQLGSGERSTVMTHDSKILHMNVHFKMK